MQQPVFSASLSLVVPCYNESDRITLLFDALRAFDGKWPGPFEVVLVNDGSEDHTLDLMQTFRQDWTGKASIQVLNQPNTGKGGALKNGVLNASGDFMLTIDADMAALPDELFKWLELEGGCWNNQTIYIGSREHPASVIRKQNDRKVAGKVFNRIIRVLTPLRTKDTQCGFKLYPREVARRLFGELQSPGWSHDVEILYKAYLHGIPVKEMPLLWKAIDGSKISFFKDSLGMLVEALRIVAALRKDIKKEQPGN